MKELNVNSGKHNRSRKRRGKEKEVPTKQVSHIHKTETKPKFFVIVLALLSGGFNIYHVSSMHENYRHFSHLSSLEREMSFRTEMGLYFSYYKRIVEAPRLIDGLFYIMNDNLIEYPDCLNAIKRFNIYPELVIGALYRLYRVGMEEWSLPGEQCWPVDRGNDLPPVNSCEGMGEPTYFYLNFVWLCAGLTVAVIFLFGYTISDSIAGGILSTLCFYYNHGEATRVQWTPPLRESFSYPFCLAQMLAVTRALSLFQWKNISGKRAAEKPSPAVQVWLITFLTWISLTTWQFAQFVLCTQTIAIYFMHTAGLTDRKTVLMVLRGLILGLSLAILSLFGNKFLICSLLTCLLISVVLTVKHVNIDHLINTGSLLRLFMVFLLPFAGTVLIKTAVNFSFGMDDAHVFNIFRAKFTGYKDFHTMLYTCAAEFDFMPIEVIKNLSQTLLLPAAIIAVGTACWSWFSQWNEKSNSEPKKRWHEMVSVLDADVVYTFIQLAAFGVMAVLVMRLKLFLTPHLCIAASLLASRKYFSSLRIEVHCALIALAVGLMSIKGVSNMEHQRGIRGEYSNIPMEQLMMWIDTHASESAVFAGPMSVMANVALSTKRPIVNHPHYEDIEARERTKKVYMIFGRRPAWQVFEVLSDMGVDYVVLEEAWCLPKSRAGCSILEIWDTVEEKLPWNPVCPKLFHGDPDPFERVFSNGMYVVLKIHQRDQTPPSYVELVPPMEYIM
ncbi:probable C-mannosyltransferase DPY19L1 [Schistocerca cancellata]|uniref:probable C-mannosyltransferase DPY19L1 n=1 Tax=Schistocerca cancellata TaxID=274614 RepID=UPI00211952A9|nr:probable C-mannosyltransferase DPY19L1 [Schistocerca cancellata]